MASSRLSTPIRRPSTSTGTTFRCGKSSMFPRKCWSGSAVLLDIGITLCLNIDVMRDERLAVPHQPLDPGRAKDGLGGVDAIGLEWCVRAVYDTVQYSLGELALPPFRIDRLADRVGTDPDIAQELAAGLISHPG